MARPPAREPQPECGTIIGAQVYLDRRGFSPGEIDGRAGHNLRRAWTAFTEAMLHDRRVARDDAAPLARDRAGNAAGFLTCDAWAVLSAGLGEPTTRYTLTDADLRGPFMDVPGDLMAQAALPALAYRSVEERLGEKFHAAPSLLRELNGATAFIAGQSITVPHVDGFDIDRHPKTDAASTPRRIEVSKREGWLRVLDSDGGLLMHAPVSSGSTHDPLPLGEWRITTVAWKPAFHYNPDLFWDADESHAKATIKPGPNGPVGVAWLGINVEHYGIHGTAHPERVGHAESHGCVRLTNWDVARLLTLVKEGTPVTFRD